MAKRGRPPVEITLTGTERRQLQSWARRHSSAQNLARRCKIILLCEDPALTGAEIAAKVGCNTATVSKWRKRFGEHRLDDYDGTQVDVPTQVAALARFHHSGQILKRSNRCRRASHDESIASTLDRFGALDGLSGTQRRVVEFLNYTVFHQTYTVPPDKLSTAQIFTSPEPVGGEFLPDRGMRLVPEALAEGVDVEFNTEVIAIRTRAGRVAVTTSDGTTRIADKCIVTVPLGVLKHRTVSSDPPLPAPVEQAIDCLEMGRFYKLVMQFDQDFWSHDNDFIGAIAQQPGRYGSGDHVSFMDVHRIHNTPILTMFAGTSLSDRLEAMGESDATEFALQRSC